MDGCTGSCKYIGNNVENDIKHHTIIKIYQEVKTAKQTNIIMQVKVLVYTTVLKHADR